MDVHAGGVVGRLADAETISESIGVGSKLFSCVAQVKKKCACRLFWGGPGREEFETTSLSTAALALLCISFDEQVKCLEMESAV